MTFRIKNLHRMLTVDEKLRQLIIGKTIADIYIDTEVTLLLFTDGQSLRINYGDDEEGKDHNERDGQ